MPETTDEITAVRRSHDRLVDLLTPLGPEQLSGKSYASEWSIADVASHLGSQAEIFTLFLDAGLTGSAAPGVDAFRPIWDRWNALAPTDQAAQSIAANEQFVSRLEGVAAEQQPFSLDLFGSTQDLDGFAAIRLREHAVHTWDIAVALDPAATVAGDAVDLLIDEMDQVVGRAGKPIAGAAPIAVETTDPARSFLLTLTPSVALSAGNGAADVTLPAEAFIRLIYGRLDPEHTPAGAESEQLAQLRGAFPGF